MQKLYLDFINYVVIDHDDNHDYIFLDYELVNKIDDIRKEL